MKLIHIFFEFQSRAVGAAFLSCYAGGLTDHIPFALTIATD